MTPAGLMRLGQLVLLAEEHRDLSPDLNIHLTAEGFDAAAAVLGLKVTEEREWREAEINLEGLQIRVYGRYPEALRVVR